MTDYSSIKDCPSSHSELIVASLSGFGASTVAIGCARAWLSLQTGIVAAYETSLDPGAGYGWVQSAALVIVSVLLSLIKLGPRFVRNRTALCLIIGILGAVLYGMGLYVTPGHQVASIAIAVLSIALFCWMLRLWCEDNCSDDLRAVLVRLCLSFVAQYLFYSVVFLVPAPVQRIIAIATPVFIMACLSKPPYPYGNTARNAAPHPDNNAPHPDARPPLTLVNVATLAAVIVACCASHGLLFGFSETVSGVWLLGSLIIAGIALCAVISLRNRDLFKGFVCIALLTQCLSVVVTLSCSNNNDWISLAKSMSYAVSMVLTFSIACYLGARKPTPHAGAHAARWVALYFVAFYSARYFEQTVQPNTFVSLVIVLLCLVVSAVLMLGNDWSALAPQVNTKSDNPLESQTPQADEHRLDLLLDRLTREKGLTQRETYILGLLLRDAPIKEIADRNQVSVNTVRSQVQSIYRKLDVHSREELANLTDD